MFQKDSNINVLFSAPLMDYSPHIFISKSTRSGNVLKQIFEMKMAQSRSHNLSSMSRMREYDKIMTLMEFSSKVNCLSSFLDPKK